MAGNDELQRKIDKQQRKREEQLRLWKEEDQMLEEWKAVAEAEAEQQRERIARMKEEAAARVVKKKKEAAEKAEWEALAEEDLGMAALEAEMEAEEALMSQVAGPSGE